MCTSVGQIYSKYTISKYIMFVNVYIYAAAVILCVCVRVCMCACMRACAYMCVFYMFTTIPISLRRFGIFK